MLLSFLYLYGSLGASSQVFCFLKTIHRFCNTWLTNKLVHCTSISMTMTRLEFPLIFVHKKKLVWKPSFTISVFTEKLRYFPSKLGQDDLRGGVLRKSDFVEARAGYAWSRNTNTRISKTRKAFQVILDGGSVTQRSDIKKTGQVRVWLVYKGLHVLSSSIFF